MKIINKISQSKYAVVGQWLFFIVLAALSGWFLEKVAMPAALLLGPMLCTITMGVLGFKIRMPKVCFKYSQGIIGCLIAHAMTLPILIEILGMWDVMLVTTVVTLLLSVLVGILSVRYGGLPGSTAAWGTSPGGAATMVAMAEDYGADARVVATMQYIRVICVVLMAALVSHILGDVHVPQEETIVVMQGSQTAVHFFLTLIVLLVGVYLGRFMPAGFLLIPMLLGTLLQLLGYVHIVIPHWLVAIAYGVIGAYIGFRFDRETLRYVMYAMPIMFAASMLLIILCGVSALFISWWLGVDYLSAYLATSPGGLDSLSVVAIDVHADIGLVMAMQTLRLFAVILTGPMLSKYIARFAVEKAS
ncbi:hypothetical protein DKL61_12720 [Gammaproteobacteria bacterium ESL0073]|nr:hypothetical protein DKL61_12720 [Gammaproteobacteria bacterium ESL0073]